MAIPVVYFIKVEGKDTFKIGFTEGDPSDRLASIQTYCPFPVSVYGVISTTRPRDVEQLLHRQFDEHQTTGEWFNIPVETINALLLQYKGGALVTTKKVKINLDTCPHCGQNMPGNTKKKQSFIMTDGSLVIRRREKKPRPNTECLRCGSPVSARQKYCGNACKQAAHRQRQKAKA